MKRRKYGALAILLALTTMAVGTARASECGLSCCIAAGVEGVGSSTGLTATLQYDTMNMKAIRQGTTKVSPTQAIINNLATRPAMSMYMVPTKMTMQKISANIAEGSLTPRQVTTGRPWRPSWGWSTVG